MHILIFDTILEQHVPDSLADALRALGHRVTTTGKVWYGTEFPSGGDADAVRDVVDHIIADHPDVVFVMRAATLAAEEVERLKAAGIRTVAWFSDDPVLYATQTQHVARAYDITLHTATEPALRMYENELGVQGWHFPFFTSGDYFPRTWQVGACDLDLVFIGNTHTRVKQWRYDLVAGLDLARAIYGRVSADPAKIAAGEANSNEELTAAATRGRWGLNINQRFADYDGSPFDYPKLAGFGEFSLPSRVIQLGAIGVPCITLSPRRQVAEDMAFLYSPAVVVESVENLHEVVRDTTHEELVELSELMHAFFATHHTALARARFLEWLLADPIVAKGRGWTPPVRATAFREFTSPPAWRVKAARKLREGITSVMN